MVGRGRCFGLIGLIAAAATLVWQVRSVDIHAPDKCLMLFKFSAWTGWVWGIGLVLELYHLVGISNTLPRCLPTPPPERK